MLKFGYKDVMYVHRANLPAENPKAPLGSISVGGPLDCVATDIVGPLHITPRGNRNILTVTDSFTKWLEVYPITDQTAETCAAKILDEYIGRFGCPLSLHSDQGSNFESDIFRQLCQSMGIRKTRTSVRNPKGNGCIERSHRTLLQMIRAYLKGEQSEWDLHLGCLTSAFRSSESESTGLTSNMLMLGREVRTPLELQFGHTSEKIVSYGDYVNGLRCRLQMAHDICRRYLAKTAKRRKDIYDAKVCFKSYQPGDAVWYLHEQRKDGVCPKLQPQYIGPCVILKKYNDLVYCV
jgi:transposase InsO family protein